MFFGNHLNNRIEWSHIIKYHIEKRGAQIIQVIRFSRVNPRLSLYQAVLRKNNIEFLTRRTPKTIFNKSIIMLVLEMADNRTKLHIRYNKPKPLQNIVENNQELERCLCALKPRATCFVEIGHEIYKRRALYLT